MNLKDIVLPELGEGVIEGEILKIKVSKGESILMDQVLVEVMTDKASVEVPSSISGKIQAVNVSEGDIVSVGTSLFTLEVEESLSRPSESSEKAETSLESSAGAKASSESSAKAKESFESSVKAETSSESPQKSLSPSFEAKRDTKSLKEEFSLAAPATRKLAKELGVALHKVQGQGPQGAVRREDLIGYIKDSLRTPHKRPSLSNINKDFSASLQPGHKEASMPTLPSNINEDKREPLRGIKRLMFESMALSKATIPHFTLGEQAPVERLAALRKEINLHLENKGLKTGYLAFCVKAVLPVLKEFPLFNSVYDPKTKEIVYRKDCHIGFAVDGPDGLIVPVLKEAHKKSLLEIIQDIKELSDAVRAGTAQRENLRGASITLTNLGSLGGLYGTPIINPPEMAIIGIYRLFNRLVQTNPNQFEEKPFMNFSITCDHRFIDGATAARFLKSFISRIAEPSLFILD